MSNKSLTLPSGATVVLRDPKTLKQKDRAKLYAASNGNADMSSGMAVMDGLIAVLIESWSLDLLIPSIKIEMLGELEIPDYDALMEAAQDAMPVLFPQLAKTVETEADPKVTTENSND